MDHNVSADEALQRLIEGNQRFQRGEPQSSGVARETLAELAREQHPFATILGCYEIETGRVRFLDPAPTVSSVMRRPSGGGRIQFCPAGPRCRRRVREATLW